MKVYRSIDEFSAQRNVALTTGTFDGVHVGHRKILDRLNRSARQIDGESVLLTFHPHPRMVLFPDDHGLKLLTTMDEKTALLEEAGIDHLVIHPFTKEFSRTSSIDFIREIVVKQLNTQKLVIGYDHHFGRNREGSFEHLKETGPLYGFDVEEIPVQDVDDVAVSSTKIRKALSEGDVATAESYLARPYRLSGTVIHGDKLGRELGYPTANISIADPYKLIPANGVYACYVLVDGEKFKGMLNIGLRPTVEGTHRRIEVNILNFDRDIYDSHIVVLLKHHLRDERKFEDLELLRKRLEIDRNQTEQLL